MRLAWLIPRPMKKAFRTIRAVFRRLITPRLEGLSRTPDLFHIYRYLQQHPDLERKPGGWLYKGKLYPDYLTVEGSAHAIFREAIKFCEGKGIDIGAGLRPLRGAIPVDICRGPGTGRSVSDFADGSLGYLFSSHCPEHIQNWREALAMWGKKLKSGGTVFLYLPHPNCAIWRPNSPFVGDGHKWIPTPKIVSRALEELGCKVIDRDDGPNAMFSF